MPPPRRRPSPPAPAAQSLRTSSAARKRWRRRKEPAGRHRPQDPRSVRFRALARQLPGMLAAASLASGYRSSHGPAITSVALLPLLQQPPKCLDQPHKVLVRLVDADKQYHFLGEVVGRPHPCHLVRRLRAETGVGRQRGRGDPLRRQLEARQHVTPRRLGDRHHMRRYPQRHAHRHPEHQACPPRHRLGMLQGDQVVKGEHRGQPHAVGHEVVGAVVQVHVAGLRAAAAAAAAAGPAKTAKWMSPAALPAGRPGRPAVRALPAHAAPAAARLAPSCAASAGARLAT